MWKIFGRVVTVSAQVPSLLCNSTLAPTPLLQLRPLTERCFVRTLETHRNAIYQVISSCSVSNSGFYFCDIPYFFTTFISFIQARLPFGGKIKKEHIP